MPAVALHNEWIRIPPHPTKVLKTEAPSAASPPRCLSGLHLSASTAPRL